MIKTVDVTVNCSFCDEEIVVTLQVGAIMPGRCPNRPSDIGAWFNHQGTTDHRCKSERHLSDLRMHDKTGIICSCKPPPSRRLVWGT